MTTDENERSQANMKVSISNYVGTATLAVIAGAVALYTFILQNYSPRWYFYVATIAGLVSLVASFIVGGRGANSVADRVGRAEWAAASKTWEFNAQAILTMLGLVLVIVAAFLGNAAPRSEPKPHPHCRSESRHHPCTKDSSASWIESQKT